MSELKTYSSSAQVESDSPTPGVPQDAGAADDVSVEQHEPRVPIQCPGHEVVSDASEGLGMLKAGTCVAVHFNEPTGWCIGKVKKHTPQHKRYTTDCVYDDEPGVTYPHRFVAESYGTDKLFVVLRATA